MQPNPENPIEQAASVLLARSRDAVELFVVRRAESLRFFGGFLAFPGGKIGREDRDQFPSKDFHGIRRITAVRELFEETGVLLARKSDGSFPPSGPTWDQLRQELLADRLSFFDLLKQHDLAVQDLDLILIGEVTTPDFTPIRYATTFFLASCPPNQKAEIWPGELDQGYWAEPDAVLKQWERGECLVSPPTVSIFQAIRGRPIRETPERLAPFLQVLADGALHPIFFAPDVRLIPLRTLGLPPSTHTNAYLVGRCPAYLIDPGPADAREQQRLFQVLDEEKTRGRTLKAVILTHHHPDHIGAATACAEKYDIPVWAHPLTARHLGGKVKVHKEIRSGDRLDLGTAADGQAWHLQAIHTPGHASGHLAFFEPHYRLLFVGDMVSTISSVVIAPPDGDLAVYLDSLHRLRAYDTRLLFPAHGSASARPRRAIDECLAHRAKREEMLLAALSERPKTQAELVTELYKGVPDNLVKFAALQLLAGLQKLEREGRVQSGESKWRLRTLVE